MKINVPTSWQELNAWQLQEIVHLFLQTDKFEQNFPEMIFILFRKNNSWRERFRLWKLVRQIPFSQLQEYGRFLLEPPKLHTFPEIPGVLKPADRLANLSIVQYSFMDQFYHAWAKEPSHVNALRLAASVYRIRTEFDDQDIPEVARILSGLDVKQLQVIAFSYMSCYRHIADTYPVVFPKPKTQPGEVKKPAKPPRYVPFYEVIVSMSMEELKPLGNLHQCNRTRIYEFMNVFSKIIIHYQNKQKEYEKRK